MKAFFINNELACVQVTHVILDKDYREISAVELLLPVAHVSIWRCHVLQIASKGRDADEKKAVRKVCQRLVFAKSAEVYETAMGEQASRHRWGIPFILCTALECNPRTLGGLLTGRQLWALHQ